MNEIKTEYKGIEISYDQFYDLWSCRCDYGRKETIKLSEMKTWIDNRIAYHKKKNFVPFEVICNNGYYNPKIATVTSMNEKGNINVTFADKSRLINVTEYVVATESNKGILRFLNAIKKDKDDKIKQFNDAIEEYYVQLFKQ